MQRIMKQLAQRNPDQAARLKMAWQRSKDDRNLERIGEIETLLRSEYFNEAFEKQKQIEAALARLLDILLDRDAERKDLKDRIEKLEGIAAQLSRIIEDERDQYLKSEKFADPEKALQRAAAAKAKLADLIAREQALIAATKGEARDASLEELERRLAELLKEQLALRGQSAAEQQEALAARTKELADALAKLAQSLPDGLRDGAEGRRSPADQAAGAVGRAALGMGEAGVQMRAGAEAGGAQEGAEQDLREAQDALKRLAKRLEDAGEKRLAQDQQRIRDDAARLAEELQRLQRGAPGTDSGAGEVQKAQGDMQKAEGKLQAKNRADAVPHEEEAKKELENAYKKLEAFEKELKRLIELPDYEKMAEEQQKTGEDTDELLKKMKEDAGREGDEGGAPGQQGVEGARGAMDRAQRNLRGRSADRANKDQKEALERLEKAREELEEILRQMREEEQLMLLEALERRFDRMLQQQTRIFKETLSLHLRLKDSPTPPRAVVDKAQQLGDGEAELSVEAEKVLEILREEGTTIVIPDVIEDMKRDLSGLATRLRKLDAGDYTQAVQQDVMETLRELLEVIKEELNKRQGGEGGGEGQEGENEDNLLPTSAELKMLKSLQVRVNKRTSTFDRMIRKEEDERLRIAEKQDSVGTLTRTMADRLNRQEDQ
jgi:ribosomal protein L29